MGGTKLARSVGPLVVACLVSLSVVVSTAAVADATAGGTAIELTADDDRVATGETATYDVVVASADGGVGAYDLRVALGDATVGSITEVATRGDPGLKDVEIAANESLVTVRAAAADTAQTGRVTVVSVTVRGTAAGSTDLDLAIEAIGDEEGNGYEITEANGAELSVFERDSDGADSESSNAASSASGSDGEGDDPTTEAVVTTERADGTTSVAGTTPDPTTDETATVSEAAFDGTTDEPSSSGSAPAAGGPNLVTRFLLVAALAALGGGVGVALKRH